MRRAVLALLFCILPPACQAAQTPTGRWEGRVEIPGRELTLVVDLSPDTAGAWTGSIIVPGLDIKGAPLANIVATGSSVRFDIGDALGDAEAAAAFQAQLASDGTMVGEMRQAGNSANFALTRTGPPQVEPAPLSTPVARELEGEWIGEYELGGYARHVTLNLRNHDGAAASAEFVIVGKKTTRLPVDLVAQEGDLLSIESHAYGIRFEGRRVGSGEIDGRFQQGTVELPLVLHRPAGGRS